MRRGCRNESLIHAYTKMYVIKCQFPTKNNHILLSPVPTVCARSHISRLRAPHLLHAACTHFASYLQIAICHHRIEWKWWARHCACHTPAIIKRKFKCEITIILWEHIECWRASLNARPSPIQSPFVNVSKIEYRICRRIDVRRTVAHSRHLPTYHMQIAELSLQSTAHIES